MKFQEALNQLAAPEDDLCVIGRFLTTLDADDTQAISDAIKALPKFRVYRACKQMGLKAAQETFYRHYDQRCRCAK